MPCTQRGAARPRGAVRATSVMHLLVGLVAALGWLLTMAAEPAAAHAVVVASSPADRITLSEPPVEVRITFSEAVNAALGGLEVLDGDGERVDIGQLDQPSPEVLRIALLPDLRDGTYIANYQLVSADGHPITGAIVFGVGVGVDEGSATEAAKTSSRAWEGIGIASRFLCYLGSLAAAGVAFFLAFVGDGATGTIAAGRWIRRLALVGGAGALGSIASQSALATGRGPSAALDTKVLREVLNAGLGWQTALLFAGLAAVVIVPVTKGAVAPVLALSGWFATASAYVLWGHATESPQKWVAMAADVVHASVAAIWFGGLVALTVVLRARLAGRSDAHDAEYGEDPVLATARLVVGFSTAAAVSVALLWISGAALAVQTVGSIDHLADSSYGRALVAKLAIVVVLVGVAGFNRFRLVPSIIDDAGPGAEETEDEVVAPVPEPDLAPERDDAPGEDADDHVRTVAGSAEPAWRSLVGTLRIEAVGIVGILLITGALVNLTPPELTDTRSDLPFSQTLAMRRAQLNLVVSPARTGTANSLRLTYSDGAGRPVDTLTRVTLELSLRDKNIGPISREGRKGGPGHFILEGVTDFAVPGTWTISVQSRTGPFDVERTNFQVPIERS